MFRFELAFLATTVLFNLNSAVGRDGYETLQEKQPRWRQNEGGREYFRRRSLQDVAMTDVNLFFELQFLNESKAIELETKNGSFEVVSHFCDCVQQQANGDIVSQAAASRNFSLEVNDDDRYCILGTARTYDPEAENIFGVGHLSMQLHVAQAINLTAEPIPGLQTVTEVLETGYDIPTGGQRIFMLCLRQSESFNKVLSMDLRRGLSPTEAPLSSAPTKVTPSLSTIPTRFPTRFPTTSPSATPTEPPTPNLTWFPTGRSTTSPSSTPSIQPTGVASEVPTESPSEAPSWYPSIEPTKVPTKTPTTPPTLSISDNASITPPTVEATASSGPDATPTVSTPSSSGIMTNPNIDPFTIAAIAGGAATILVTCVFVACLWFRQQKSQPQREQTRFALTTTDGQLGRDGHDLIPGVVELDQRSLAETTLGEQTAGRHHRRQKNAKEQTIPQRSPQAIQPMESFDENSLYTTPFSVQRDDASSQRPSTAPPGLPDHLVRPVDYEGNILFPLSDSTTTSSDGVSSFGPLSGRLSADSSHIDTDTGVEDLAVTRIVGPIDLNPTALYNHGRGSKYSPYQSNQGELKTECVSKAIDDGSFASDVDTWSCDFEDFDPGSVFYEEEAQSRSLSHSSKSTAKVQNIASVLGDMKDTEADSHHSFPLTEQQSIYSSTIGLRSNQEYTDLGQTSSAKRNKKLMLCAETENVISPSSNISYFSRKSSASRSSWSSRKVQTGQSSPPSIHEEKCPTDAPEKSTVPTRSPLAKLLDTVTNAISPLQNSDAAPAVTPEESGSNADQRTHTSLSKEDDSTTLLGLQFKDEASASSASTGMSPNPWLFEKVAESLGPKSVTADMESLSGKSNLSVRSSGNQSRTGAESMASFGSQLSYRSGLTHSEISFAPRTSEHDLRRLEKQLAALDSDQVSTSSAGGVSSITGASLAKASLSSMNRAPRISRKKRIVVMVPPGKLGVILANRHDGKGTVVSEIRESSPLYRMLSPGDKLVAIDDEDMTNMVVSQITSFMASRVDRERRLTVITSVPQQYSK